MGRKYRFALTKDSHDSDFNPHFCRKMRSIENILTEAISQAFTSQFQQVPADLKIEYTREGFVGDYTWVAFPYLKQSGTGPEATAQRVGETLMQSCLWVASFNVVKGFLNIVVKDHFWLDEMGEAWNLDDIGYAKEKTGKRVVLEYSSPNTNKPLHLGHVRNNLLGYSLSEILKAKGHEVVKVNLINDRGIHICKSMLAWLKVGEGETPESSGMKGDKLVGKYYVQFDKMLKEEVKNGIAQGFTEEDAEKHAPIMLEAQQMLRDWEAGNQEVRRVWMMMNEWVYQGFEDTYQRMGVDFDRYYYESETYLTGKAMVEKGLTDGHFFQKSDGSVWVDLANHGLDQKLLLRGDGTSVYMTQDLGTALIKYADYEYDQSIYVVGNEQDYHFQVLKIILTQMQSPSAPGIFHLSYGMVDLPSGKMKSREGTVVDADDLMDEVVNEAKEMTAALGKTAALSDQELEHLYKTLGLGALKYFLLKVDPAKRMLFNPAESIDLQGNTGPFIQYTYARICSVLRNAEEGWNIQMPSNLALEERELLTNLYRFSGVVNAASEQLNPSLIAQYIYDIAKLYNRFYHEHSILKEEQNDLRNFRLALCQYCGHVIRNGLKMLGIGVVERM